MEERCETCRFWRDDQCKRHAPSPISIGAVHAARVAALKGDEFANPFDVTWPPTEPDDWCGEFEPTRPALAAGKE